jgi:SAM-dependent methyltransferase
MLHGRKLNFFEKLSYRILSFNDIDNITLRRSIKAFAESIPAGAKVLDAGAGLKPYQTLFSHCEYESCDFAECEAFFSNLDDGTRDDLRSRHTYICPIDAIPVADDTYDFVLCSQVLEHVPYPQSVAKELYRILKPNGQLLVTVPQGYGIHGEPYNFFYFTRYGIDLILTEARFEVIRTEERGGYFRYLYDRLANAIPRIVVGYKKMSLMMLILSPIHILLAYVFGPALLLLEPLDKEKRFTLGYISLATKQGQAAD